MPEAWELGPSNYTPEDVQIQFRIREVLVLPEYRGKQNVIQKVRFSILSTLEDLNWEQHNSIWLDIHNVENADNFISIDEITEEQLTQWIIDKHLGSQGFLNVQRSHLQIFNENLRDKISQKQEFSFVVDQPLYVPPPPPPPPPIDPPTM